MTTTLLPVKRHPTVPFRAMPLSEQLRDYQIRSGKFVTERGVPYALPVDNVKDPTRWLDRVMWERTADGDVIRPGARLTPIRYGVEHLPEHLRAFAQGISREEAAAIYRAKTGRDMHFSVQGNLYGRHWHTGWANPFTGETELAPDINYTTLINTHWAPKHIVCDMGIECPAAKWVSPEAFLTAHRGNRGFTEELGWLSGGLVTAAFVSEVVDELVSATSSEFADFDYHEVGTSNTAESNAHTALQTTSGIARATGTPTDSDPDYVNVATITADASETWQEHGIFNNSTGPAMMDRSLTGGQAVVSSDEVEYTYTLTVNAET